MTIDRVITGSARVVFAACLACAVSSNDLTAQTDIEFTAFAGAYLPLTDVLDTPGGTAKQQIGGMYGVRGLTWVTPAVGAELLIAFGTVKVEGHAPNLSASAEGRTLLASGRARWRASNSAAAWPLFLSGGIAVISRGGDAFEPLEGTTDVGVSIGVGTERAIRNRLRLRIDVEDYISQASFTFGAEESESKLQNDILLSVGLSLAVSGPFARGT